jgi:hypothetical protein
MEELTVHVTFSPEERRRLATHCQAINITFPEYIHHATLQTMDEMEAMSREYREAWRNV